jgi:hypothetical protein
MANTNPVPSILNRISAVKGQIKETKMQAASFAARAAELTETDFDRSVEIDGQAAAIKRDAERLEKVTLPAIVAEYKAERSKAIRAEQSAMVARIVAVQTAGIADTLRAVHDLLADYDILMTTPWTKQAIALTHYAVDPSKAEPINLASTYGLDFSRQIDGLRRIKNAAADRWPRDARWNAEARAEVEARHELDKLDAECEALADLDKPKEEKPFDVSLLVGASN